MPCDQNSFRIAPRAVVSSLTHSAMMSLAPPRASSTRFHPQFRIDVLISGKVDVKILLVPEMQRQGFQALFPSDGGPSASLGTVRQIDVLQGHHRFRQRERPSAIPRSAGPALPGKPGMASRRSQSSRSCDKRSRMLVTATSSRLAVASLRYRAINGTVAPSSSKPTVACTCRWLN